MASTSEDKDDLASQFCSITGAATETAVHLLEACKGDLQMAIGMHMDGSGNALIGKEETTAELVNDDEDEIRAPIPQMREQLVDEQQQAAQAYTYGGRVTRRKGRSVFDGFRDFQAETEQAEERASTGGTTSRVGARKKHTLEDLFRPPVELLHKGSFHSAKKAGEMSNKWLLVNIQNVQEFSCQVLNRDVWSNASVKDIVKYHFIFWQVYSDSDDGKKFMQFYQITKWPYIAILDPITGENIMEWNKLEPTTFIELVNTFLADRPRPDSSSESPPPKRLKIQPSIVEDSEDNQLEAAIKASIKENHAITLSSDDDIDNDYSDSDVDVDLETFTDSDSDASVKVLKKSTKEVLPILTTSDSDSDTNVPLKKSTKGKVNSRTPVKNGRYKKDIEDDNSVSSLPGQMDSNADSLPSNKARLPSNCDSMPSNTASLSSNSDSLPSNSDSCHSNSADINTQESQNSVGSWKFHLGQETDEKTKLLLRFPDGKREPLIVPCTSKLRSITEYVSENQIDLDQHELVTNFPRRNLSSMDLQQTLEQAGLHPQETIFIQEKS